MGSSLYRTWQCLILIVVINQMDTSQAHLSSKSGTQAKDTSKPENLSKDELTAVLKYGAQKMYVIPIITTFC